MKTTLLPREVLVKKGPANLQRKLETVGGYLYLTNQRLIFEPHSFNFQTDLEIIELHAIESTGLGWTKFLGVIPIFPNAFFIVSNRQEYRFTVLGKREWLNAIPATTE